MNAPPSPKNEGSHLSEIPASREMVSQLTLTSLQPELAFWLRELQHAVLSAPCGHGLQNAVRPVLMVASEAIPDVVWAMFFERPAAPRVALGMLGGEVLPEESLLQITWDRMEPIQAHCAAELRITTTPEFFEGSSISLSHLEDFWIPTVSSALTLVLRLVAAEEHALENSLLSQSVAQSNKLASIGQIAANTLHELNNPLTTILAYSDFLCRKVDKLGSIPLAVEDVGRLHRIMEAAEYIQRMTRNLVDYARPSGEAPSTLRIREILEQAIVFCEHPLNEIHAVIERQITENEGYVLGFGGELTQVFVNLILNACHAMPRGYGRILLHCEQSQTMLLVTLQDNGHGISHEHALRIFDPFYTTKKPDHGTGLGLSIVKSILERHHGTISLQNPGEVGAKFVVRLPLWKSG